MADQSVDGKSWFACGLVGLVAGGVVFGILWAIGWPPTMPARGIVAGLVGLCGWYIALR